MAQSPSTARSFCASALGGNGFWMKVTPGSDTPCRTMASSANPEMNSSFSPGAGLAVDGEIAAALLDDAVHRRETEPGAFAALLGGEERLEDARLDGLLHADTVVADRQHHVAARLGAGVDVDVALVEVDVA